ncbi:MAG: response regulator transcription factor [Clostridia bacterium]|nr:response regulator transcription factor [Clostridia bacterium]
MFKILVVEDDKNLRKLIVTCLEKANYTVFESMNGERALELMDKEYIDLIVTDIMMPEMNGYELIKELREAKYEVPILIITAKEDIEDKKQGFNLGADDYMVKPINIDELILRVKSLLKRTQKANEKILKFGEVTLDYDKLEIQKKGKIYQLTQKEFYLTYKLLSSPDKIFKRQELIEEIWGLENESDFRTVDVHIKRIREKLEEITEFEIITIRGIGYKAIIKQGE